MARPEVTDGISELSPLLKTTAPRPKKDTFGMKFAKGHRTHEMVRGKRPVHRSIKRAVRP